jgi:serine/threonine protein kinase
MPPGSLQIEGKTLRQLLQPPAQSLDCQTIIDWIGRTASALSAARYTGIVHRDIKPVHGELLICPEFREF